MRFLTVFCGLLLTVAASAATDRFGVEQLFATLAGGREWFARWEEARSVAPYSRDAQDGVFFNEAGSLSIKDGVASAPPGLTRLLVTSTVGENGPALTAWRNVEMTVYVRRAEPQKRLGYQALYLSARSGLKHNDAQPCEGTSYHCTVRLDGQIGFKKEVWHTGGYTGLQPMPAPRPWATVPAGEWVGIKFVCRNVAKDTQVRLQCYLDVGERNQWRLAAEYVDAGEWLGAEAGCERPQSYIITEARPAVYFRTDELPVELKKFSVREIAPE